MWRRQAGAGVVALAVTLAGTACGEPEVVKLSPRVALSEERLAFPDAWTGHPVDRELYLVNTGGAPASLDGTEVRGSAFDLAGTLPRHVPAAGRLRIAVRFTPRAPGKAEGRLIVRVDGRSLEASLEGTGRRTPSCDDGQPCTEDAFDPNIGACRHAERSGSCDDGNACTVGDRCVTGRCAGRARDCDDGLACTQDACEPASGCTHVEVCDDGNPCTSDGCAADGACAHAPVGDERPCGAGTQCAYEKCIEGACVWSALRDGVLCDDGNACTVEDACVAGGCRGTPWDCDDGNPCTEDGCTEDGACTHAQRPDGTRCDDGVACTEALCTSGTCQGGTWALRDWVPLWGGGAGLAVGEGWVLVFDYHPLHGSRLATLVDTTGPVARPVARGYPPRPPTSYAGANLESATELDDGRLALDLSQGIAVAERVGDRLVFSEIADEDPRTRLAASGRHLYFGGPDEVVVMEVPRQGPPIRVGSVPERAANVAAVPGEAALLLYWNGVLSRWSLANPAALVLERSLDLPYDHCTSDVAMGDGHAALVCTTADAERFVVLVDPEWLTIQREVPVEAEGRHLAWLDSDRLAIFGGMYDAVRVVDVDGGVVPSDAPTAVHGCAFVLGPVSAVGCRLYRWQGQGWDALPDVGQGRGGGFVRVDGRPFMFGNGQDRFVDVAPDGRVTLGRTHYRPGGVAWSASFVPGPFRTSTVGIQSDWLDPFTGETGSLPWEAETDAIGLNGGYAWQAVNTVDDRSTDGPNPNCETYWDTSVAFSPLASPDDAPVWWDWHEGSGHVQRIVPSEDGRRATVEVRDRTTGAGGACQYSSTWEKTWLLEVTVGAPRRLWTGCGPGGARIHGDVAAFAEGYAFACSGQPRLGFLQLAPDVQLLSELEVPAPGRVATFDGERAVWVPGAFQSAPYRVRIVAFTGPPLVPEEAVLPFPVSRALIVPEGVLVSSSSGVGLLAPICP